MSYPPTLVFVPGSWHRPACYDRLARPLRDEHNLKCAYVALPSTVGDPKATFKDDLDAARKVISAELARCRDVIVVAHSHGGMVGCSAIKGLTRQDNSGLQKAVSHQSASDVQSSLTGGVLALILIASGFTIPGLSSMDPLFGHPPPAWRVNKETGFADLVVNPWELFYHDLDADDASYWADQLTPQSLKALFEGGEHVCAGWQAVLTWYIGTVEDRGLPVLVQRVQVGMARGQGGVVHHVELQTSHSPFLSKPKEVVEIILEAVDSVCGRQGQTSSKKQALMVSIRAPSTWLWIVVPMTVGSVLGWCMVGIFRLRRAWAER